MAVCLLNACIVGCLVLTPACPPATFVPTVVITVCSNPIAGISSHLSNEVLKGVAGTIFLCGRWGVSLVPASGCMLSSSLAMWADYCLCGCIVASEQSKSSQRPPLPRLKGFPTIQHASGAGETSNDLRLVSSQQQVWLLNVFIHRHQAIISVWEQTCSDCTVYQFAVHPGV